MRRRLSALAAATFLVCALGCQTMGMRDPQPGAESILDAFGPPTPEEAAALFGSDNPDERYRGAVLLTQAWFAGEEGAPYLDAFEDYLLNDPDPSIRAVCARGLGNHGGSEYAPSLVRAMREDADLEVREECARALQRVHNPDIVRELANGCREPDPRVRLPSEAEARVRVEVAIALGQYADPFVVDTLIAALDDSSLVVHRAAIRSLKTLTGQDFGHDAGAWLRWKRSTTDLFAAQGVYEYPVFTRRRRLWEYVPFVPGPPNEQPSTPAGLPLRDG